MSLTCALSQSGVVKLEFGIADALCKANLSIPSRVLLTTVSVTDMETVSTRLLEQREFSLKIKQVNNDINRKIDER